MALVKGLPSFLRLLPDVKARLSPGGALHDLRSGADDLCELIRGIQRRPRDENNLSAVE
ncbi:hypothetical protein BCR39DRAFT_549866 [Naematelia encephala]|uniref:Uncharacterized protein n=1 Tax=Naematelia encephala TaxID=71784 RepID=A0A1Y2AKT9_9TREE|nr:hypothetical protein BCR39DRAFT_549866 [Naematelia encephala]